METELQTGVCQRRKSGRADGPGPSRAASTLWNRLPPKLLAPYKQGPSFAETTAQQAFSGYGPSPFIIGVLNVSDRPCLSSLDLSP